MKKAIKKVIKLVDFLIRILTKGLKKGVEVLDALQSAAEKGSKLAPVLIEIGEMVAKLQEKRAELSKLAEE